ncbi:magnesium transporter CorA family protein [Listeria booriae]|uniref:Magnesium transporter CorA family protein n=1 Tax=Listeria booriae TaxID=1552123 RepID=A0A7X0XSZ4_9LIST|nr:magnesium transporter CorA family protein [Listeria booriae]MBC1574497.1 magnesium transporter CorA family protein [Listeria booriae]MBC1779676.1 magnesium transporter CorA family protein [Listeria booriae]MBC2239856.1 magnesium transporter CorA family protein [Listeria booriae]MBC2264598.1 magnesium transporter CorA family protein [Listeria booriae]
MIEYYKTKENGEMGHINSFEKGCWVNVIAPSPEEIDFLSKKFDVPKDHILDPLDKEERSRIELKHVEENFKHSLVIIDCPLEAKDEMGFLEFRTIPIGIITTQEAVLTIALKQLPVLEDIMDRRMEQYDTGNHIAFVLQILYAVSYYFLKYLNHLIDHMHFLEKNIRASMKNEELYAFMAIQRSLVFFATALQSNKAILDKMATAEHYTRQTENMELLQDVIIENKQAIAMTDTYTQIVGGMSDTFSSVIANNLNRVMKFLTSFTIILSLPTIVASIYGMNVKLPFSNQEHAFGLIMIGTLIITIVTTIVFWRKKYF